MTKFAVPAASSTTKSPIETIGVPDCASLSMIVAGGGAARDGGVGAGGGEVHGEHLGPFRVGVVAQLHAHGLDRLAGAKVSVFVSKT